MRMHRETPSQTASLSYALYYYWPLLFPKKPSCSNYEYWAFAGSPVAVFPACSWSNTIAENQFTRRWWHNTRYGVTMNLLRHTFPGGHMSLWKGTSAGVSACSIDLSLKIFKKNRCTSLWIVKDYLCEEDVISNCQNCIVQEKTTYEVYSLIDAARSQKRTSRAKCWYTDPTHANGCLPLWLGCPRTCHLEPVKKSHILLTAPKLPRRL